LTPSPSSLPLVDKTRPREEGGRVFTLPFKGRARVGMGRRLISNEAEIQIGKTGFPRIKYWASSSSPE